MRTLKKLYQQIPDIKCPAGCTDCCSIVPLLRSEALAIGKPEQAKSTGYNIKTMKCMLCDKGCTVYDNRPFSCRIFGSVVAGPNSCKKVLTSDEDLLSVEEAAVMLAEYSFVSANTIDIDTLDNVSKAALKHDAIEHKKGNLKNRSTDMVMIGSTRHNKSNIIHYMTMEKTIKKLNKKQLCLHQEY